MNHSLSVTCPQCGKLNLVGNTRCSNCGAPLPTTKLKSRTPHRLSKRFLAIIITFSVIVATILVGVIIQHNQILSYATFLNAAPQRIELLDYHHRLVRQFYLIGDQRHFGVNGIHGTAASVSHLSPHDDYHNASRVAYADNRTRGIFTIFTPSRIVLTYPSKKGRLTYSGTCHVVGNPQVRYFRWLNLSGGVTK